MNVMTLRKEMTRNSIGVTRDVGKEAGGPVCGRKPEEFVLGEYPKR
jgi:hypothetical protein